MIAATRECLTPEELTRLVDGRMAPDDFELGAAHVDACSSCRGRVGELQLESVSGARDWLEPADSDPLHHETACQIAMARVCDAAEGASAADDLAVRRLGPYRLFALLGQGGMGTVCLAEHERLKRKCAIKLLSRQRVSQAGWLDRFDREMTTVASLERPNVVRATDAGHEDGWHYLVMEYLDGLDAGCVAHRVGRLETADACEIVRQAALGLAHIHASGLVHRDVKPSNLMVTRDGTVKLLDLGLVLAGDDPLEPSDRLTTLGHLMGTIPYMGPEQLVDSRSVDAAADVYGLGASLYRFLTGRHPHTNRNGFASQVLAITQTDPEPPDSLRADLDPKLSSLTMRLLDRDPSRRPTAGEVAEQLGPWAASADLPRLVREAEARRDVDGSGADRAGSAVSPFASLRPAAAPPRRRWPKFVAAACFGFLFVVAGVLLKLQTERGTLVVESELDGVTLVVSREDEVVETLQVEAGGDNQLTLRQGTYRVGIDGAAEGFTCGPEFDSRVRLTARERARRAGG